ncbi:hypothetical protein KAU11_09940 [Candidatus Babeliales bacterium]|nr:hypothetical protein [Candidatus Babeliales bacterium]
MKYILTLISVIVIGIVMFALIIPLENQLDDCRFEVNHLQTKLWRLEELNDYIPSMNQILPPLVLAQLKAATLMIRQQKYHEYERVEQPLLTKKEIGG